MAGVWEVEKPNVTQKTAVSVGSSTTVLFVFPWDFQTFQVVLAVAAFETKWKNDGWELYTLRKETDKIKALTNKGIICYVALDAGFLP